VAPIHTFVPGKVKKNASDAAAAIGHFTIVRQNILDGFLYAAAFKK